MSRKLSLRIACGLLITLAILLTGVSPVYAQSPANDNFADATIIISTPFADELNTAEATFEENEPSPSCSWDYYTPGHTVWYTYTPEVSGVAKISISADHDAFLAIYTGPDLLQLTELACLNYVGNTSLQLQAGQTYYIQSGSMWGYASILRLNLDFFSPPPNDNFEDASVILLGETLSSDNTAASVQPGEPEPSPDCGSLTKTVWFIFTPTISGSVTADSSEWVNFVAAYTGSNLESLTALGCRPSGDPLPIMVEAGTTYYFQVGNMYEWWYSGPFTFQLYETPPPTADFGWGPGDPNMFDTVEFCDWSSDPVNLGFTEFYWEFGDGTASTGNCGYHRYTADGDYSVWHNVQTSDGRTDPDGVIHAISVRTHDVAVIKIAAPKSASVGQTRQISVNIKNNRYPERVQIELFKSIPGGYELVGVAAANIPVRGGNRTTAVTFSYTFVQGDADVGKVTFKAVATIIDARDALPADNEAISAPTKVQ